MTERKAKPTKITGVIRAQLDRIETLLKTGYTVDAVREMFETELGISIKPRSFEWSLYHVRKERKEQGDNCIVQYNSPLPETAPSPSPALAEKQPEVETPLEGEGDQPSPTPPTPTPEPWKPKKRFNPIGAIEEMKKKGEI